MKTTNNPHTVTFPRGRTALLLSAAALLVSPLSFAQDDDSEEVFELSPFTVEGANDQGYRATSTLAGTRIRTDLKDVGSAISVVTEEFLRDTSATDNESLLVYTTGTEVAGLNGSFAGGGDFGRVDTDSQRLRPNQATRVRGLAAADNTRDFFPTDIPWDSFNVDRIDLQRGPNSVLFGLGSPAGVINATTNGATYSSGGDVEVRIGSYGTTRYSVDYNKAILEDELAIRVAALSEDQKYMQDGAFEEDERYYVSLKWDPKFLSTESSSTTFKANYEKGSIDANRPRVIPPIDMITKWFDPVVRDEYGNISVDSGLGKLGVGPNVNNEEGSVNNANTYNPWIGTGVGRIFDGPVAVYNSPNQSTQDFYFLAGGSNQRGTYQGIASYNTFATNYTSGADRVRGLPGSQIAAWKPITLSDPTIFDFYNQLIDGPNKSEWQDWEAYDLSFSRTMMDNKLGFEVVYDVQNYEDGQTNLLDNAGQAISVDIMRYLPDGTSDANGPLNTTLNPNFGRPYIGGDAQNNNGNFRDRDNFRLTAYYDIDFRDTTTDTLGSILGRHVFTGVYSKSKFEERRTSWIRSTSANWNTSSSITQASRYIANVVYLGPSLENSSSASGAYLPPLQQEIAPTSGSFTWSANNDVAPTTQNLEVWTDSAGDRDRLYRRASYSGNETDSKAFVWQGYLFDGNIVPVFGYREDTDQAGSAGNVPGHPDGISGAVDAFNADWTLPSGTSEVDPSTNRTYVVASGINRTFSLVAHTPAEWRERMGGWGFDLTYSNSENFRPDASRRDLVGNIVAPTTGETEEYGFVVSGFNNRLQFKANHYETKVFGDTLSPSSIANSYMIGAGEGWGRLFSSWISGPAEGFVGVDFNRETSNGNLGTTPEDLAENPRIDPSITEVVLYQPRPDQTIAQALADQKAVVAAWNNESNWPSQQFRDYWVQDWDSITPTGGWADGGRAWSGEPAQFAVTGDTVSEGWEYELFYQPTENWDIVVNASKTEARRVGLAETYAEFVEERADLIRNTPYGDVRLWGPNVGDTLESKYNAEFYSNYQLFRSLLNSNVAELRPWRANVVTNYRFSDGRFAGLNVGGAWRWEDEVVIGYPFKDPSGDSFDTDKPFMGEAESNVDLWAGYELKLSDSVDWRIQLNVRNAFESERLVPVTVQPDGTPATSRIKEGTTWTLANTFSF